MQESGGVTVLGGVPDPWVWGAEGCRAQWGLDGIGLGDHRGPSSLDDSVTLRFYDCEFYILLFSGPLSQIQDPWLKDTGVEKLSSDTDSASRPSSQDLDFHLSGVHLAPATSSCSHLRSIREDVYDALTSDFFGCLYNNR